MTTPACFRDLPLKPRYTSGEDDPLHDFYIPVLQRARHYDRAVGFFSSNAFVVAAQGIAHLIAHGGTMRLLIGAQLSPEDAEAIRRGEERAEDVLTSALARFLPDPHALADHIARQRLEALAWMVAQGQLQIRVVLPTSGRYPYAYFHIKSGILTDACGHTIAFHGSINETAAAWTANYEDFSVFASWRPGEQSRVADFQREFARIWTNEHPRWHTVSIPEAIRRRLLRYTPTQPPQRDPLERTRGARERATTPAIGPILARFLRDAPYFPNANQLGAVTSTVRPWPHQRFILRHVLERYPQRFLLADEVGLGKTITTGLLLRQLYIQGWARRILILAPKSLLPQWQDELYEKFNFDVPIYDGYTYHFRAGRTEIAPQGVSAWEQYDWLLASAQMVRRRERKEHLLKARPWDVIVVDEAHHARRRSFASLRHYRPNQLLLLLQELAYQTTFMFLLTATPIQIHPVEMWDLLSLLGLPGQWALEYGQRFVNYFKELEKSSPNWDAIIPLLREEWQLYPPQEQKQILAQYALSAPQRQRLMRWLKGQTAVEAGPRNLPLQKTLKQLARQYTPVRRLTLRHTRALLQTYQQEGRLTTSFPQRRPRPRWIEMTPEEKELYHKVSDYIADFYQHYEKARKGLGFVLTIYRRRLTSSLYALRRSLERRLQILKGNEIREVYLSEEDEFSLEEALFSEEIKDLSFSSKLPRTVLKMEEKVLEELIELIKKIGEHDSKSQQLFHDLQEIFQQRERVLIFTQYTDTLDYLKERLRPLYGDSLACYSGRGGEMWDGQRWKPVTKEVVKNAFRTGKVRILLATDAASEGLNLQTCGVLINYDMPWNPMRVEQRIGRIDRIGQIHDEVWIYHYFYRDTIEEKVYRRLGERIGFFQSVIGPLQPILMRLEDLLQRLTVLPLARQEAELTAQLARLEREVATVTAFDLDAWAEHNINTDEEPSPWRPEELEAWVQNEPELSKTLLPLGKGRYHLRDMNASTPWQVTFRPEVFETHPDTVVFLSYGSDAWKAWLTLLEQQGLYSTSSTEKRFLILESSSPLSLRVWYMYTQTGEVQPILTLQQLRDALHAPYRPWTDEAVARAKEDFHTRLAAIQKQWTRNRQRLVQIKRQALLMQGLWLWYQIIAVVGYDGDLLLYRLEPNKLPNVGQIKGTPFEILNRILQEELDPNRIGVVPDEIWRYLKNKKNFARTKHVLREQTQKWLDEWSSFKRWARRVKQMPNDHHLKDIRFI